MIFVVVSDDRILIISGEARRRARHFLQVKEFKKKEKKEKNLSSDRPAAGHWAPRAITPRPSAGTLLPPTRWSPP